MMESREGGGREKIKNEETPKNGLEKVHQISMNSRLTLNLFHNEVGGPCMINACMTSAL